MDRAGSSVLILQGRGSCMKTGQGGRGVLEELVSMFVSWAAAARCHTPGGSDLRTHFPQFWRPQVPDQGAAGLAFLRPLSLV